MLKLLKILLLFLTVLLFASCENKKLLKDVNEIAIVTFKFNKNFYEGSQVNFLNSIYDEPFLKILTLKPSEEDIKQEDSQQIEYYDSFIKRFYERLNNTSLIVKPTSSYSSNEEFLSKKLSKPFSKNNYHVSQGYINANLDRNHLKISRDKVAQKLCKIIGVDAVASVSFRFFQIKAHSLDSRKFGIVSYLVLKNKKGKTIFNRPIYAMSTFHPYEFPIYNNDRSFFISLESKKSENSRPFGKLKQFVDFDIDNDNSFFITLDSTDDDQGTRSIDFEFSPENIVYLEELEEAFFSKLESILLNPYQKNK